MTPEARAQLLTELREARKRIVRIAACMLEPCNPEQLARFCANLNNMIQVIQEQLDYLNPEDRA